MPGGQGIGKKGELRVVELCPCPNCHRALMVLPPNYPLYDVQCTACSFRAQIKTVRSRPVSRIWGAGWQIMDKVLKSGYLVPPLIVHWVWKARGKTCREVRFYPFIPRKNLRSYALSATGRQMFIYTGLQDLPWFVLHKEPPGRG